MLKVPLNFDQFVQFYYHFFLLSTEISSVRQNVQEEWIEKLENFFAIKCLSFLNFFNSLRVGSLKRINRGTWYSITLIILNC